MVSTRRAHRLLLVLVAFTFAMLVTPAAQGRGHDSFSVSLFGDDHLALWPIDLSVQIVELSAAPRVLHRAAVTVADGVPTTFAHAIRTDVGQRRFVVAAVARHHARGAVEIEYDLKVSEARYGQMPVGDYMLHRLGLGPTPALKPSALRIARSDIVSTPLHHETFSIDNVRYEIRITASPSRG